MPSQIEQRYGVPLPIDVLWRELETRYGAEVVAELQAVYREASRRYGRAGELNRRKRLVAMWDRQGVSGAKVERYRASLSDAAGFLDGG